MGSLGAEEAAELLCFEELSSCALCYRDRKVTALTELLA